MAGAALENHHDSHDGDSYLPLLSPEDTSAGQAPAATMTTVLVTSPPPPTPLHQQQASDAAPYPAQSHQPPGPQQQRRVSASILDVRNALPAVGSTVLVATGVPIDPLTAGPAGQLFFLPDLPDAVRLWHGQRLLMIVWLISSLASLILFAPLVMASGLFLAAEVAAVCGLVAATVHLCERQLAASNTLELGSQMKLVVSCGSAAAALDVFTLALTLLLLWGLRCDPSEDPVDGDMCVAVAQYALLFAVIMAHHAVVSWMCAVRARNLLPLLNPVSSGAVQL